MAADWCLLEDFPKADAPRLRPYGWLGPALTFGYTQCYADIAAQAPEPGMTLQRRPSGGGLVDHRCDWTYALVIPATHRLAQVAPLETYREVHHALAQALGLCQVPADITHEASCAPALACFAGPTRYDVINPQGRKLAGAALKRTRSGLLLQGSLDRRHLLGLDTSALLNAFAEALCRPLQAQAINPVDWPPEDSPAFAQRLQKLASDSWNRKR